MKTRDHKKKTVKSHCDFTIGSYTTLMLCFYCDTSYFCDNESRREEIVGISTGIRKLNREIFIRKKRLYAVTMSLLYNQTSKQMQQLRRDLGSLRSSVTSDNEIGSSLSLIGAISTTITSVGRLLSDFEAYVANQTDKEAQAKNQTRLDKLRNEYEDSRVEFGDLRTRREEKVREIERIKSEKERNRLFTQSLDDGAGIASGISDNPYSIEFRSNRKHGGLNDNSSSDANGMMMDQQMKLDRSNAKLDEILELGRHAFEDIVEQNETILRVKEKMSQGLTTLGVSRETVGHIEKILWEDKIIFYVAGSLTLFIMWLIWKYLG